MSKLGEPPRPPVGSRPLLQVQDICVTLASVQILDHVSFDLAPQEIVTIVGPNGAGKSTLIKTLIGSQKPDAGHIRKASGLKLGYVPQKLEIDQNLPMTAGRFVTLHARQSKREVAQLIEKCQIGGIMGLPLHGLSGGQLQRVALVRSLLLRPDVLILDEPTQGLDQPGAAQFYALIEELRREDGLSVLMVSHELHVVMATSDRVICLNRHICCQGTPEHVASAPQYRALFGTGTLGTLALYRHQHSHQHGLDGRCEHD